MHFTITTVILLFALSSVHPANSFFEQGQFESPFSDESLQPGIPSPPLNSSYSLLQELSSWSDLSVIAILFFQYPEVVQHLQSTASTILVPDNDAVRELFAIFSSPLPPDTPPSLIVARIIKMFLVLGRFSEDLPTLPDFLNYHSIPQNLSESELVELSPVQPLLGPSLNLSLYPTNIQDEDDLQKSSRFARQIATPTGRMSIISSILVPINVRDALEEAGIPVPVVSPRPDSLFTPLTSLFAFVSARSDMIFLKRLLSFSEHLRALLASSAHPLYLFAPNDYAFIHLVETLLPENHIPVILGNVRAATVNFSRIAPILQDGGVVDLADSLGNITEVELFHDRLAFYWKNLDGLPGLEQLVLYHILNTSSSCVELIAAGPQRTLLTSEDFPVTAITVTEQGLMDASEREPASSISAFATRNGFVTVLDSVLLPFTIEKGKELIALAPILLPPTPDGVGPVESGEPEVGSPSGSTDGGNDMEPPGAEASPFTLPTPDDDSPDPPECFPSTSSVKLSDGTAISMDKLEAGTHIHVGKGSTSKVFLFTHRQLNVTSTFVRISTTSRHRIALTPGHYLYANGRLTAAAYVKVGHYLDTDSGVATVSKVERVVLSGLYAPHTAHGDIMVDGIRVSGYSTALHPVLAQALLLPLRFLAARGMDEPLGRMFYGGAEFVANLLPGGRQKY